MARTETMMHKTRTENNDPTTLGHGNTVENNQGMPDNKTQMRDIRK